MKFIKKRSLIYIAATLAADFLFFGLTNPAKVASPWLVVGFGLAVVNIYWLSRGVTRLLSLYSRAVSRQRQRLTRTLTVIGGILVAMQSIGQLTPRDLAVLAPLVTLAYFYLAYGSRNNQRA